MGPAPMTGALLRRGKFGQGKEQRKKAMKRQRQAEGGAARKRMADQRI